jgi:type II secretory pathway pseudopilin PulG
MVLAILAILAGLLLPAIQRVRQAAARVQSQNNLKQIALGIHNHEAVHSRMPTCVDSHHYSAITHILPYIEQDNLYKNLNLTKDCDDAANNIVRSTAIKVFINPEEEAPLPIANVGPTGYQFVAGAKAELNGNDGVFPADKKISLVTITDGTSNTLMAVEMMYGQMAKKADDVARQHVALKKDDLKGIKESAGVKDFENNKNIAANRGGSWIDGRFLQATMTMTRGFNDKKPDVACAGAGGLSALRSTRGGVSVAMSDGAVRWINAKVSFDTLKALATRDGGEVLGADW